MSKKNHEGMKSWTHKNDLGQQMLNGLIYFGEGALDNLKVNCSSMYICLLNSAIKVSFKH